MTARQKYRSQVDDHAFTGCNCNLVAPVPLARMYLAAGSTVAEDVLANALYIARSGVLMRIGSNVARSRGR